MRPNAAESPPPVSVTVIMPICNEADYIARSLGAVLMQDYPVMHLEVLIADGMSTDATRAIIEAVKAQHPTFETRILDNPAAIVPSGFNTALRQARGDVIIRVDGHCEIAPGYVRRCVELLAETDADCVGGPLQTVGETLFGRTIALAQSSPFGVGGAVFRMGSKAGRYVDTVAFGAYRRAVFARIGAYDEELVRNQDDEFNFRLTQTGGKIWLDPSIHSIYYSRASLRRLWRQYYEYGVYKVRVMQKRGAVPSWRHLVPGIFVLALLSSLLAAVVTRRPSLALPVAGPYLFANIVAGVYAARKDWGTLPLLPLAFLVLHLAYGLGFWAGLWRWRTHFVKAQGRTDEAPTFRASRHSEQEP